jgi:hypothetical protein
VQLFPWLETTLRYTDVRTKQYSSVEAFSGDQTYKDKAFDVKLRLWEESYWMPQVSVVRKDIGGTGLFDAEYIVASKAWGPFDFSLGLGWGYLGTSGNVKTRFAPTAINTATAITAIRKRAPSTRPDVPRPGLAVWRRGVSDALAAIAPEAGIRRERLLAGLRREIEQKSKFNVGAIYRVTDWADVNLSYERGNTGDVWFHAAHQLQRHAATYNDNARPHTSRSRRMRFCSTPWWQTS